MNIRSTSRRQKGQHWTTGRRREFLVIAVIIFLCAVVGWVWHGAWLLAALGLLHLIGNWGRYTHAHTLAHTDERRIESYQKVWGDTWRTALNKDHPDLARSLQPDDFH